MAFFDRYPYTNFHNINLDWVLQAVKSWGALVEQNNVAFQNLQEANESFKTYVTHYLQTLNVSDEINDKLDSMLSSGVLSPYFAPYINTSVDAWLEDNITGTSPALDSTFTLLNAAANAQKVGFTFIDTDAKIGDMDNIRTVYNGGNLINPDSIISNVLLNASTGNEEYSLSYWATPMIPVDGTYTIRPFEYSGAVRIRIYKYLSTRTFSARVVVNPADYPRGYTFSHTGYVRINIENGFNNGPYINPNKYLLVSGSSTDDVAASFIPYNTAYDRYARAKISQLQTNAITNGYGNYTFTDANNADINSVYYVTSSRVTNNLPVSGASYLITYALSAANVLQVCYEAHALYAYFRACVAGSWGAWKEFALTDTSLTIRGTNYTFTDCDDAPDNATFYITPTRVPDNNPIAGASYLTTIAFNASNKIQVAYNAYGTTFYYRGCVQGTWGTWTSAISESDIENVVNIGYKTSSIAMFPSIGCIGDSFTAGYLYNKTDSQYYDPNYAPNGEYPDLGYPAVIGREHNISVTAYAKGGLTSGAWLTDPAGLAALQADSAKGLYTIALGLNDKTQGVDIETYISNMTTIINAIRTHAPHAKIILIKCLWTSASTYCDYISEGVESLSQTFGIPYIETVGDAFFDSTGYKNNFKGNHPTAPLYAGIAKRLADLIGKCIFDNPSYFYNFYTTD